MQDYFKPRNENLSRRARRALRLEGERQAKHPLLGREHDPYSVNDILIGITNAISTDRGPSAAVWGSCPWESLQSNPSLGVTVWDDFVMTGNATMSSAYAGSLGKWTAYGSAGATITDANLEGGVVQLQVDGDDEGLALLSSTGSFRMVTTSTLLPNKKLWFEARVSRSTITTDKFDAFVGLMKPTLASGLPAVAQPITTTDDTLMTAGDLFGFHLNSNTAVRGGPTEVAAAFALTSGTVNYPTNTTTMMASTAQTVLAANTKVKLGFIFDPAGPFKRITAATARQTAGQVKRAVIRYFVNGMELPTFLTNEDVYNATATQAFPTAFMCPVVAIGNTAASGGTFDVDWVRCAQLATA